eukprot:CAMPEP_0206451196 /NCGR_PEP_ID=MMETSP0324_2-20121206/19190_1 /ASSEMBLY_ACC=CAM_ASM_000836 /TAXON_ID=2866 /ORGANISM="Crypthecodinium cohnii, Strain Seligo" /LENGTH=568 /DNA_ID=CAMNT_0053921017 /DNA_START=48 /DNA_END=1754 /DNA_ORIENTATION=-
MQRLFFVILSVVGLLSVPVNGKGGAALRSARIEASELNAQLNLAMGEALGCGGQMDETHLSSLEEALLPMWQTLPKSSSGLIERRSLRYLVHRHFNRRSALHIRGFEPNRAGDAWGDVDILSQKVPAFVETVLQSQHKADHGFTLRDAALMVATLEQLILDGESATLETIFNEQGRSFSSDLSDMDLIQVLESYMIHWMMGEDQEGIRILLANRTLLETAFPNWEALKGMVKGEVMRVSQQRADKPLSKPKRPGHNVFSQKYSFEDAHSVAGDVTKSFASFWESECSSMKHALVEMDTHNTGRVPLAKFYGSALESDWRFGESEAYLRELGALDESSTWYGKQVIISNYIQATSNCIVAAPHYSVCCVNDCEAHLEEIEEAIKAPSATPEQLLAVVGNMSSHMLLDDAVPSLTRSLKQQLQEIAASHDGTVPIHGRLFAQWLHYVFPRECPFPHKAGVASLVTPMEYGDGYIASQEDMVKAAAEVSNTTNLTAVDKEELQWMSQWSPEEELVVGPKLQAPWEASSYLNVAAALLLAGSLLFATVGRSAGGRKKDVGGLLLPTYGKRCC